VHFLVHGIFLGFVVIRVGFFYSGIQMCRSDWWCTPLSRSIWLLYGYGYIQFCYMLLFSWCAGA
jgi:hypothetical protein